MSGAPGLPLRHALALGLLHGPTELLPVSSSAHTTLVPWIAGWSYERLDARQRKSFEVALHAGTAAALLLNPPAERLGGKVFFLAAGLIPAALAGSALGGEIERRLGTPATIAAGLLAGSGATIAGELYAHRAGSGGRTRSSRGGTSAADAGSERASRSADSAGARDGLALGIAQALALLPGVSRSGATIATARARGFSRRDADRLSWRVGLPVVAGAASLQGYRLARAGVPRGTGVTLATGAASAFASTLLSTRVLDTERRARLLGACAAYRVALALLVVWARRDKTNRHEQQIPKK
jgi:undecaprenyl-diphosphatase